MVNRVGLIRPGNKGEGYQGLAGVKALEPPHWMLCRATQLRQEHGCEVSVVDMAYHGLQDIPECDEYEIWPTGNHPSAYIQEQETVADLLYALGGRGVAIMDKLPRGLAAFSPAWDLVEVDMYRAHNWHTWGQPSVAPYGTVHTSINCPYGCTFCAVGEYYGQKYWARPVRDVVEDIGALQGRGVRNIKIMDELFVASDKRVKEICEGIKGVNGLNMWAYGRVDTVLHLSLSALYWMKTAGVNWIGLGIESGNEGIRQLNGKGGFSNKDVVKAVEMLRTAGIHTVGNFIFGFPQDTTDTMRETFEFAYDLRCEYTNFYCMVAYPDTPLEEYAKAQGWYTPRDPLEYAQYSKEFHPLQTHTVAAEAVLAKRDWAFQAYHQTMGYRAKMVDVFGGDAAQAMEEACKIPLHRDLLQGTWEDYYRREKPNGA